MLTNEVSFLGGKLVRLTKMDIALIFGIELGDKRMNLLHGDRSKAIFFKTIVPKGGKLTQKWMKEKLVELVKKETKQCKENFVKLLCLYAFVCSCEWLWGGNIAVLAL